MCWSTRYWEFTKQAANVADTILTTEAVKMTSAPDDHDHNQDLVQCGADDGKVKGQLGIWRLGCRGTFGPSEMSDPARICLFSRKHQFAAHFLRILESSRKMF